jgi:cell wall assembly regulator SMI1
MAAKKKGDLSAAIAQLLATIAAGDASVARTLRKPTTAAKRAKLEKKTGELPSEVHAWFAAHDGQSGSRAIGPSESDRLLGVEEAIDAWTFLEEEGHAPWKSSWLPLATNGAGDYLVIDRSSGALLGYQHDARARPKRAASLLAWVEAIAQAWTSVAASTKESAAPEGWTATTSPKAAALKKKPAGTAYLFRATAPALGKGIYVHVFWKQAANTWFQSAQPTLAAAWTSIGNNLVPFQATPDAGMEHCLRKERVLADGNAAHVGLYEKHEPTPPFAKKR